MYKDVIVLLITIAGSEHIVDLKTLNLFARMSNAFSSTLCVLERHHYVGVEQRHRWRKVQEAPIYRFEQVIVSEQFIRYFNRGNALEIIVKAA